MLSMRFLQNKKSFLAYNDFRKKIFARFAPRDSEVILYLLPWLLSVNHPSIPGHVRDLEKPFKVYGVDKEILKRENVFKNMFRVKKEGTFLDLAADVYYYVQRSNRHYEKIIERSKRSISHVIPNDKENTFR